MGQAAMIGGGMGLMSYVAAGEYSATKGAGEVQQIESETAAKMEELGATQREGDRKARLAEALASQVAGSGASGISAFEGSPLTILNADIEAEHRATQRDKFQTSLKAESYRTRGKMAKKMAKKQAKLGLLSSIAGMGMQAGMAMKPGAGGRPGANPTGGTGGVGSTYNPYSQSSMVA